MHANGYLRSAVPVTCFTSRRRACSVSFSAHYREPSSAFDFCPRGISCRMHNAFVRSYRHHGFGILALGGRPSLSFGGVLTHERFLPLIRSRRDREKLSSPWLPKRALLWNWCREAVSSVYTISLSRKVKKRCRSLQSISRERHVKGAGMLYAN